MSQSHPPWWKQSESFGLGNLIYLERVIPLALLLLFAGMATAEEEDREGKGTALSWQGGYW